MSRTPVIAPAFLLLTALLGGPAWGASVCRTDALGTTWCSGPTVRPAPRPSVIQPVQALDRVAPAPPAAGDPGFVPARERSALGNVITNRRLPGLCRPDALGNLRCQ